MATRLKMKAKRTKGDDKANEKLDEPDSSILSQPLTTSINNLLKLLKLYQNTNEEIRQYLTSECDILYECRICRSIFRSLSNFILHKRKYCQEKFNCVTNSQWNDDEYLNIIFQECKEDPKPLKKNLNAVINDLTQKRQTDLEIEKLFSEKENKLSLENIAESNSGVFQTFVDDATKGEENMKLEAMEMYRLSAGQTAILGPDGKVASQKSATGLKVLDSNETTSLRCPKCNIQFSTRKTLLYHIKFKHENERVVYPCPECSETFATTWSVYRHLFNIHQKTITEARKMRPKLKPKAIKNVSPVDKKSQLNTTLNDQQKIDEENQAWMDNFESDNDIQMCGGCGRRFERKAALNSHSQTCQKRINARNIINVNKQKRTAALEEKTEKKNPPNPKMLRLDSEMENKYMDNKHNVTRKRKIGIQIRYDYTKCDKNVPIVSTNTEEKKIVEKEKSPPDSQNNDVLKSENSKSDLESDNRINLSLETADLDSEVVSIASSSPSVKEDQDPLSLKDAVESDCEIEEFLCPLEHSIFDAPKIEESTNHEEGFEDHDQYKVTNINESTLKLIKLINSDIPAENLRPTLDDKMANFVNIKKLKCIPCDIKYGNISKLRHHMASHFNWNRFRCDICLFKAYDKLDVFEHIKRNHNIMEFEKIEAVILQMPDWQTLELASHEFVVRNDLIIIHKKEENDKRERESSSSSPDCSIVDNEEKEVKKQVPVAKPKKKIKIAKVNNTEREHVTADSVSEIIPKDPLGDPLPEEPRSESRSSSRSNQDPELKKMVYEVIFGNDVTISQATVSNTVDEEKDNVHVVPTDVSNVISRPVRNRVKPLLYKDFVYDLHGFKDHHKTVFESNLIRKKNPLVSNISESLEDINDKISPNSNKISFGAMDNTDSNLNLQKRSISFPDSQAVSSFPETVVSVVDPQAILNESAQQSDDDDIYIIENEELVAVK